MHETFDRCFSVEHSHVSSFSSEVVKLLLDGGAAIIGAENHEGLTWLINYLVLAPILVTVSVSTHNDGLGPSWHESRDILADNGFSENSSIKNVSDGSVGRPPHLLEVELHDSVLVGSDGGAFDSTLALGDSIGCVNCNLIVGGISAFY